MVKRMKNIFRILIYFSLFSIIYSNAINSNTINTEDSLTIEKTIKPSIYSWKKEDILDDIEFNETLKIMDTLRINELYQYISTTSFSDSNLPSKIAELSNKGISTYYLTGDPSWWEKPSSIKRRIDRLITYNESVDENSKLIGIVLDIEPWTLDEGYDLVVYGETLKEAYDYAQSKNIKMVTTIPFWLDESVLDIVISNCDRVSVMNYTRNNHIENLTEEISIAKKYNKELEHISETKEPDGSGIPDSITYFNYGLDPLYEDWINMKNSENILRMSYHDLVSMKIMMEKYPNSIMIATNLVIKALEAKDDNSISKALDAINAIENNEEKKQYLLDILASLNNNNIPSLEPSKISANIDVYIKSENMLLVNLSTNQITFEDFSGIDNLEKINAIEINISSSLPYQLNAYLADEIYNSDKSKKIDIDRLNIKENSDTNYKEFTNINEKLILKNNCTSGNNNTHNINLMLKGSNTYTADIYKTIIKFEVEQK